MDYAIKSQPYPSGLIMWHVVNAKLEILSTHNSAEAARREIWHQLDGQLTGYYDSHNQAIRDPYADLI